MASQARPPQRSLHDDEILIIDPPLLNSSCPWASTYADLKLLYANPYTGAITTRTSMLRGFGHDKDKHQHLYFNVNDLGQPGGQSPAESITNVSESATSIAPQQARQNREASQRKSTLNTYGYSPIPFEEYLGYIRRLSDEDIVETTSPSTTTISTKPKPNPETKAAAAAEAASGGGATVSEASETKSEPESTSKSKSKLIIVSVTGTPSDIAEALRALIDLSNDRPTLNLAVEINLSCPNINDKPPPAYDEEGLTSYLQVLQKEGETRGGQGESEARGQGESESEIEDKTRRAKVKLGVKLPPYTYKGQFDMLARTLRGVVRTASSPNSSSSSSSGASSHPRTVLDFVTTTNTLGSCMVYTSPPLSSTSTTTSTTPSLSSESNTGVGGLAGAAIHPLSLGNVLTLRNLLDKHVETQNVLIVGVGGVEDHAGYERMRRAGAGAVGVASALGREGVDIFAKICRGGEGGA